MSKLKNQVNTWIFDLDNTLYSADSGIFQQVHELMGKFVSNHLNIDIDEAKKKVKDILEELSISDLKIKEFVRFKIGE